jgi:hypothetical protein
MVSTEAPVAVPVPVAFQAPAQDLAPVDLAPVTALRPRAAGRPAAVDADLRPVMVDKLAGDLADLTRVLLGVGSSTFTPATAPAPAVPARLATAPIIAAPEVAPVGLVVAPTGFDVEPPSFAAPVEVAPLVALSVEPVAPVVPLVPTPQEPPTPAAPTPSVPVDVVLSELSFLDG